MKKAFKLTEVFTSYPQSHSCCDITPHPNFTLSQSSSGNSTLSPRGEGKRNNLAAWLPSCLAAFTLAEVFSPHPQGQLRFGFTLAEVLITLGIIGVVAAMTMPTVISEFQKSRVEKRVIWFFAVINQALRMSVAENGEIDNWVEKGKYYTYQEEEDWLNHYILPYIKHSSLKRTTRIDGYRTITFYLYNGGLVEWSMDKNGVDIVYYINGKQESSPKNSFYFQFTKTDVNLGNNIRSKNFIEPYFFEWDGTNKGLYNSSNVLSCRKGCKFCGYCTKALQLNNWKIPSDYPW